MPREMVLKLQFKAEAPGGLDKAQTPGAAQQGSGLGGPAGALGLSF